MFSIFKPPPREHPRLGALTWRRGHWHASVTLEGNDAVPLVLSGSRKAPDETAVAEALLVLELFATQKLQIANSLFDHFEPYAEAQTDGSLPDQRSDFPNIRSPEDAVRHSKLAAVVVSPIDQKMTVEFCYTTEWDIEHTIGARFQRGTWLELCGSTLIP